jgi:hypothetical protein
VGHRGAFPQIRTKIQKSFEKSDMTIEERKMIEKPFTALGSTNLPPRLYQAPDASETPTRSEDISNLKPLTFPPKFASILRSSRKVTR